MADKKKGTHHVNIYILYIYKAEGGGRQREINDTDGPAWSRRYFIVSGH